MFSNQSANKQVASVVAALAASAVVVSPVLLTASPASASPTGGSITTGEYEGTATYQLRHSAKLWFDVDNADIVNKRATKSGRVNALLANDATSVNVKFTFAEGKITGGKVKSSTLDVRVTGGKLNRGKGLKEHSHVTLNTSAGKIKLYFDFIRS